MVALNVFTITLLFDLEDYAHISIIVMMLQLNGLHVRIKTI